VTAAVLVQKHHKAQFKNISYIWKIKNLIKQPSLSAFSKDKYFIAIQATILILATNHSNTFLLNIN
jgi:hypothetical protein